MLRNGLNKASAKCDNINTAPTLFAAILTPVVRFVVRHFGKECVVLFDLVSLAEAATCESQHVVLPPGRGGLVFGNATQEMTSGPLIMGTKVGLSARRSGGGAKQAKGVVRTS